MDTKKLTGFIYEMSSLRPLLREHRRQLMTNDNTDTIAAHSHLVTGIGYVLAQMAELALEERYRLLVMCLFHDLGETRTGDIDWTGKLYLKAFDDEVAQAQLGSLPFSEPKEFAEEYKTRSSVVAQLAKDADTLAQIVLLREYAQIAGNKTAQHWLDERRNTQLYTEVAKELCVELCNQDPTDWRKDLWTNKNR